MLEERVPFLEGQALRPGEHDAYFQPMVAEESASLFEHCARGLDQSLSVGEHGLPLIGTGDWNDGMNRVGELGKGESAWLGWFLYTTLEAFAPLASAAATMRVLQSGVRTRSALKSALELNGWDATGTGAVFTTTERRLALTRATNAASTRSLNRGAYCPAGRAGTRTACDGLRGRAADAAGHAAVALLSRRRSIARRAIQATSMAIHLESGERRPYTHAAAWFSMAFALWGTETGRPNCSRSSIDQPHEHASRRVSATRLSPTPLPPMSTRSRRTSGAADGPGIRIRRWLYRVGIEAILGARLRGTSLRLTLASQGVAAVRDRFQASLGALRDHSGESSCVNRGVSYAELDGKALLAGCDARTLVDDGQTHTVSVILGCERMDFCVARYLVFSARSPGARASRWKTACFKRDRRRASARAWRAGGGGAVLRGPRRRGTARPLEPFVVSRAEARTDYRLADTWQAWCSRRSRMAPSRGSHARIRIDPRRPGDRVALARTAAACRSRSAGPMRDDSPARLVISFMATCTGSISQSAYAAPVPWLSGEELRTRCSFLPGRAPFRSAQPPQRPHRKIQTIVVDRGASASGAISVRNVFEDYRLVFARSVGYRRGGGDDRTPQLSPEGPRAVRRRHVSAGAVTPCLRRSGGRGSDRVHDQAVLDAGVGQIAKEVHQIAPRIVHPVDARNECDDRPHLGAALQQHPAAHGQNADRAEVVKR